MFEIFGFDPLAFTKPEKMFTTEGLLSRDLFEKFAAEDEAEYNRVAFCGSGTGSAQDEEDF